MTKLFARFIREEEGQDLIEYGLLIGIITAGAITAIALIGPKVAGYFNALEADMPAPPGGDEKARARVTRRGHRLVTQQSRSSVYDASHQAARSAIPARGDRAGPHRVRAADRDRHAVCDRGAHNDQRKDGGLVRGLARGLSGRHEVDSTVATVMTMNAAQIAALSVAVVACSIDVRSRRIPNWLTFGAAAAGVAYQIAMNGGNGAVMGAAGWGVGVAFLLLPFALGGIGAGDVKLMAALGAWLGPADALWLGLYSGVAGGVMALVVAAGRGYLRQALANVMLLLTHWRVAGMQAVPELTIQHGHGPKLAYGVSILAGTMVTIWAR
jgi:prepilin peptidase CpaA